MKRVMLTMVMVCCFVIPVHALAGKVRKGPSNLHSLVSNQRHHLTGCMSVAREDVNIRTGPGLKHPIKFRAPFGYPLKIQDQKGLWLHFIDWEGNTGWVHLSVVCDVRTVVVLRDNVNVRSGPGMANSVVQRTHRGEVYKIADRRDGWTKLVYYHGDDEIGWIRDDLVFGE